MVDFKEDVYSKIQREVRAPWTQEKLGGILSNESTLEKLLSWLQDHLIANDVDNLDSSFISRILLATRYHMKFSFLKQNDRLIRNLQSVCADLAKRKLSSPDEQASWDWIGIINSICGEVQMPKEEAVSFFNMLGVDSSLLREKKEGHVERFMLPKFARMLSRDLISRSSCAFDKKLKVRDGFEIKFFKPKAPLKRVVEKREHKAKFDNSPTFRKRNEQLALKMKQKVTKKRTMKVLNLQEQKRRRVEEQKREQEKLEAKLKALEEVKKKREEELKKKREEKKAQKEAQKVNKTKPSTKIDSQPMTNSENISNPQLSENNLGNHQLAQALAFQQAQQMRFTSLAQQMALSSANGLASSPFIDPKTAAMLLRAQYQQSLLASQNQRLLGNQGQARTPSQEQNLLAIQTQQLLAAQGRALLASSLNQNLLGLTRQTQNNAVSQQEGLFPPEGQGQKLLSDQSLGCIPESRSPLNALNQRDAAEATIVRTGGKEPLSTLQEEKQQEGELNTEKSSEKDGQQRSPAAQSITSPQAQPESQVVSPKIKAKYPWLFEGCNRLAPANRVYLLKFLEGTIPATKVEKSYDVLLNEEKVGENLVQIIFRFNTGSRTWKMLKRRQPS